MTGLSKITDRILADAKADAAKLLSEADAECSRISEQAQREALDLAAKADAAARREAQEMLNRARSSEATVSRDTVLDIKGKSVDKAFALAKNKILGLPDKEYASLLSSMLAAALKTKAEDERVRRENGDDDIDTEASICSIILNAADREKYGKTLAAQAGSGVVLSDKTAPIDGGLILHYGSIEINCSVDKIIEQLRPTLEARVYRALFPEYARER